MKHYPLIRTIYLYLFTIIGLVLVVIGGVRFVDMGLKTFVFTKAEVDQDYDRMKVMPYPIERMEMMQDDEELSETEKEMMRQMVEDYRQQSEEEINYLTIRRHRDASINLAMILVGLPLYLYHWRIIRKETKEV